ncbi:MAG: ABC transporter substrate-binding protein [Treponema sp.]|jgi:raffinose/stachyose/melibiose transport system substrate-binding protein|nr:ABC transporter substrate-binding protein [Treponema sp.]
MKRIGLIARETSLQKALAVLFCAVMILTVGCKKSASGGKEITLVSNKIEIDEALKGYAAVYEKQSGIKVNIKSFGGETPYAPNIAAMFNSGTEPEIFVIEGKAGYDDAKRSGRIADLSGEPWVRDTDVAYVDPAGGNVIGFPVAIEGWGLGYNKALLAKAGIDPNTLTNAAAIKAAFEKIDSQKSQLGIDAVVSMAAGPGMTWVTGLHGVNAYLTLGLPYNNSTRYIDMLNNGQVDNARLTKFAEYYNLLFRYANRNTLLTGGYDQQLGDYAVGKTVFIHQGNWTDPTFKDLGITFDMGYVPHAFLDETTDAIFVGAPSWYLVNPKAKNVDEAKKFLIAMASTPEGHDYMVNKAGMVPAFKSVTLSPAGQLSKAVQEWSSKGKIYAWQQNEMPDGFGMNTLGPVFHQMASGQITVQEFVRLFAAAVAGIK